MLEIVEAEAAKAGARSIGEVTIGLGELSSFVDESIALYFSELSRGTVAEGASLVFQKIEALADCLECGESFRPPERYSTCPRCSSPLFELKQGQELLVRSIDVDT